LVGTTLLGVTTRATADSLGMSTADSTWLGGSLRFAYELTRDSLQRIVAKQEVVDGVATAFRYVYDSVGRLAEVRRDGVPVAVYEYDANSNRVHLTNSAGVLTATYDARDRLITYGDAQYTFGESGRLTAKVVGTERTEYHYDALGNLLLVTLPDGRRIEYVVDAMSRRIARKVNGAVVQRFLYGDGGRPVAEVDADGTVTTRYVYGARDNVPAYMERGGVTYRLLTDQLGSVRLVVDAVSGAVAQRIDYDEFGRVVADSNAGFQPFGYAGGIYDRDTRLVRFGARDYDAETGRWTAEDPIGIQRGDENLYAYVHNAPLNGIDPTGLKVQCTYVQSSGMLTCTDEDHNTYYEKGYSGANPDMNDPKNKNKEIGINDPDKQNVGNVGPIPRGTYTIEECYLGDNQDKWGPDNPRSQPILTLTPDGSMI
jgi:RHS repeat-associated protein